MFLTPHHHRTYFPFVLAAATLALLGLILFTFGGRFRPVEPIESADPVTAVEYQADARAALKGLTAALTVAGSDAERVEILRDAQTELLELVVPAEFKDLHLDLVIVLSQWANVYEGTEETDGTKGTEDVEAVQARWQEIVTSNPWIE